MSDRLTIRYSEREDRLELRILTSVPAREYRLHLTRRVTRDWLIQLAKAIDMSAEVPPGVDPETRRVIASSHHEALSAQTRQEPQGAESVGLERMTGEQPALVTRVACGRRKDGERWVLRFRFGGGESVGLTVAPATLHGVIDLLRRCLRKCDWGLASLPAAQEPTGKARKRVVH